MKEPKRITVFLGYYGSGKTELAVNYALYLKKLGKEVTIVDYDFVNPYYRTYDVKEMLAQNGISVIASAYANTNLENPALPAEVASVFEEKDRYVVFDVGGGEDGAIPLGRYHLEFSKEACDVFFVFNARRLMTADLAGALEAYAEIAAVSRLAVTAIINNTHLKEETDAAMLLEGQEIAEALAERTHLPIAYLSGKPEVLADLPSRYREMEFPIHCYINLIF